MPQLVEVRLNDTIITSVAPLSTCITLKNLDLNICNSLTDILGLESLPALEELSLLGTEVASVVHLSGSRSLKCLILGDCYHLTDAGIEGIGAHPDP
jgi:Leucine-rich repeat (LRR) protein